MSEEIKVAMVTGHHEYEVMPFQNMLRALPSLDIYPQHLGDFFGTPKKIKIRIKWWLFMIFASQHLKNLKENLLN